MYIMVHLWHPCREIDVWMVDNEEDRVIAVGQGYINLDDLRVMVISGYNTALERGVNYERLP